MLGHKRERANSFATGSRRKMDKSESSTPESIMKRQKLEPKNKTNKDTQVTLVSTFSMGV
jgi:hypothetical protein